MRKTLAPLVALTLSTLLTACPKKDKAGADASASPDASAAAATTTASAKPPPPADASKSCTVTLTGKNADWMSKPGLEFKMKNTGSRTLRFCQITTYAYDKTGKQIGRGSMSENHTLKPGEEFTSSSGLSIEDDKRKNLAKEPGVTFEAVVGDVIFEDGSEWEDHSVAPTERPKGGKK